MQNLIKQLFLSILILNITLFANSEKITLQLEWKHQFEFAGFYTAIEKGYYKDVGLEVEIKELSIPDNFEFIVSTSDYCLRKPDSRIFKVCLNKLNLEKDEVWYVGNKLEYDILGANNAGMEAIWLNMLNEENVNDYDCKIVRNYKELEEIIELCCIP